MLEERRKIRCFVFKGKEIILDQDLTRSIPSLNYTNWVCNFEKCPMRRESDREGSAEVSTGKINGRHGVVWCGAAGRARKK